MRRNINNKCSKRNGLPSSLAIAIPILMGLIFRVPGVMGLLIGGVATGFVLALFMANSGGAWDNAKNT